MRNGKRNSNGAAAAAPNRVSLPEHLLGLIDPDVLAASKTRIQERLGDTAEGQRLRARYIKTIVDSHLMEKIGNG